MGAIGKNLGDHKVTGDLAFNYAFLETRIGSIKKAADPYIRSADLAHLWPKHVAGLVRLERESNAVLTLVLKKKTYDAQKRLDKAFKFAQENDLEESLFNGELMLHQARLLAGRTNKKANAPTYWSSTNLALKNTKPQRIQSQSADFAQAALAIFDKHPKSAHASYKSMAHKLVGFAYERKKLWKEAMFAYQEAMQIQEQYSTLKDDAYIGTIGRWINTRRHYLHNTSRKEAYAEGMCRCWPYKKESIATAKPTLRTPPRMPIKASTSGFSIMKFDLDDDGKIINPEILHSWPKKYSIIRLCAHCRNGNAKPKRKGSRMRKERVWS